MNIKSRHPDHSHISVAKMGNDKQTETESVPDGILNIAEYWVYMWSIL